MFALARARSRALNPGGTKGACEYLRNRHEGATHLVYKSLSHRPTEWSPSGFHRLPLCLSVHAEAPRRYAPRRGRRYRTARRAIKSAIEYTRSTDLCLPRDPDAIKSDISGGAIYRDSAKSATTGRPDIKNRALSLLASTRRWFIKIDDRPESLLLSPLSSGLDQRREKMSRARARAKSEDFTMRFYDEFIFIKNMKLVLHILKDYIFVFGIKMGFLIIVVQHISILDIFGHSNRNLYCI